jgi:hypothetical protein
VLVESCDNQNEIVSASLGTPLFFM